MKPKESIKESETATPSGWWRDFFDDDYAEWGLTSMDPADTAQVADFMVGVLGLNPGDTIFDQCCGIGRISIPLARKGLRVLGVDLTPSYVKRAQERASELGLPCQFYTGDAASFTAPEQCDAAINFFTSFGYSEDDRHTEAMFQRIADSLKPGAKALIEYQNIPRIMAEFQRGLISRPARPEGLIVLHEHMPDWEHGMFRSIWTMIYPDNRRVVREVANRMFMPHEITRLLRSAGFEEFELMGSHTGEPYTRRSLRLIVIARKQ